MPPVNYIIYPVLVQPIFSCGKKQRARADTCSGTTSRRISAFSLLETLLTVGQWLWITLSTQESFPASRWQHDLQQLRSARICPPRNKGEVNSAIRGPIPI